MTDRGSIIKIGENDYEPYSHNKGNKGNCQKIRRT